MWWLSQNSAAVWLMGTAVYVLFTVALMWLSRITV